MFNIHCVTIMMISLICVVASVVSAQQRIDVKYSIQTIVGTGQTSFNRDGLTGLATTINSPIGLFYEERSGDLYFADTRLIEAVAGNGTAGYTGEGILAVNSTLNRPYGLFISNNNDIYIAGNYANRIHLVSSKDNKLYTFAGTGVSGFNGDGLLANQSRFTQPLDIKLINQDNPNNMQMIIADTYGSRIRVVNISTMITKTLSTLSYPFGIESDSDSNELLIGCASPNNYVIRYNLNTNIITTVTGVNGNSSHTGDGGLAQFATFNNVNGVAISKLNGAIYIAEPNGNTIRKISKNGIITTIAGSGTSGYNGDNQQDATKSNLNAPRVIVTTKSGEIFFTDTSNNRIRKLTAVCPTGYVMDAFKTVCLATCYGIVYNNSNVCGSNGKCQAVDSCVCDSGYYGLDCSIPVCLKSTNGECVNVTSTPVIIENVETSQLSNKSISIGSSENNSTSNSSISISFPSDFSNYVSNQTTSSLISLLTAVSKGGENVTTSNTTTSSIVSDIITISLALTNGEKIQVSKLDNPIQILFQKPSTFYGNLTCMYFDELVNEWKLDGVETKIEEWTVTCLTSHLTSFSVIDINLKKEIVKPNNPRISIKIITDSNGTTITTRTESNQLSEEAIIAISVSIAGAAIVCCVVAVIVMVVICMIRRKGSNNK